MLDIAPDWTGGIDEFVKEANIWLARLLPEERAGRPKDEVNPRLVRHYTTAGLLPTPRKEGREARYDRTHLLHLLALRRLMADGLSGRVLAGTLSGRSLTQLERLAQWGAGEPSDVQAVRSSTLPHFIQGAPSSALGYLEALKARSRGPAQSMVVHDVAPDRDWLHQPLPPAQTWTRLTPRPGLELHFSKSFRWPGDENGWDALLQDLLKALTDAQRHR